MCFVCNTAVSLFLFILFVWGGGETFGVTVDNTVGQESTQNTSYAAQPAFENCHEILLNECKSKLCACGFFCGFCFLNDCQNMMKLVHHELSVIFCTS